MPASLPEIRIEVHKLGHEFFAVTKAEDGREICTNHFEHNPTGLTHMGPLWLLERGMLGPAEMSRVSAGLVGRASQGQVALYGRRLYDYLFGNGRQLRKFLKDNLPDVPIHLRLSIHADAAALWRLPWEYLHDGADFVCLTGHMQLSRLPQGLPLLTPAALPLPLRLLIVFAGPADQEHLDVEHELDVVMEALHQSMDAGLVQVKVLNDATLAALQQALEQEVPHVLHYIGHGQYSSNQKGYLCFQDDFGHTAPVTALHLGPLLSPAADLRLVVLAACQSASIGVLDAFDNVAAGLLQSGVPAVLTTPTSLQDESVIALSQTLYAALSEGADVLNALHRGRQTLDAVDAARAGGQRRFDWGVPALYLRADLRPLVNHELAPTETVTAESAEDVGGLIAPAPLVGRRQELQALQRAVRDALPVIYLWGASGIGKSALAARLIAQVRDDMEGVLIVRCPEYPCPRAVLETIAEFWRARGTEAHRQAAVLLLDDRHPPTERVRKATQLLPEQRTLLVFDHFDAWLTPAADSPSDGIAHDAAHPYPMRDAVLNAILESLAAARGHTTLLFTARRRWTGLESLPATSVRELQLSLLPPAQAILLLNALPFLGGAPLEDKQAALRAIGGHPQALRWLDCWLTAGHTLSELLADPVIPARIAEGWQTCFLGALLDQLDPGARDALNVLAVWNARFAAADVAQITPILAEHVPALLHMWREMGLLEAYTAEAASAERDAVRYALPPAVCEQVVASLSPETLRMLHSQIATYYSAPFVDEARRQINSRTFSTWSEERIAWLARSANGVLGMWVRQTHNFVEARQAVNRAVAWQHHLLEAEESAAALEIVRAITPVLNRWGQTDLVKALLERAVQAQEDADRAVSLSELANLNLATGHLTEALSVYQSIYQTLSAQGAKPPMAYTLARIAHIHQRLGDLRQAISYYEAALALMREIGDVAGAGQCLHPLTGLYHKIGDPLQAIPYSQEVKAFYIEQRNLAGLMSIAHEQGLIFKTLGDRQKALEAFRESLETARTVGDELQVAANLEELAAILQQLQKGDAAIKMLQEALKLYHSRPDQRRKVIATLETLGALYDQQGRAAEAQAIYERANHMRQTLENESMA